MSSFRMATRSKIWPKRRDHHHYCLEGKMRNLIVHDDGQLRRLDSAIAAFQTRPAAERDRFAALLAALVEERAELTRAGAHRVHYGASQGES